MNQALKESIEEHYESLEGLAEYGQTQLADDAKVILDEYNEEYGNKDT